MRFKFLTATLVRNTALRMRSIKMNTEGDEFMCNALVREATSQGFENGSRQMNGVKREFHNVLKEMQVSTAGSLSHPERTDREARTYEWRSEARILFLLMLADAIAYKTNGGKKVKPVPPPIILPDPGMVFIKEIGVDRYTAKNAYGTFVMQRGNPNARELKAKTDRWCLIDPNGQVIVDDEVFRNQIAFDYHLVLQRQYWA
jgi:hypothetical protein